MNPSAKRFSVILLVMLACALQWRDRLSKTTASDTDTATWGATDPTWSPDGTKLAFSLFGSIWQVRSEGGTAEQVTASTGYHARPAWSPRGDRIAFIQGGPPAGRLTNIEGSLVLVEVANGREQEIKTPYLVAGTPAWSPDGSRIACALRVSPNAPYAPALHEIAVTDGAVRQIQFPSRRDAISMNPWVDAAWNPKRNEIFYTAERSGAAQVWSMDPAGPPMTVQLPLTRYRPEDIVLLDSISALPDGSGVVYSAMAANGKGNYELYRISREGGAPEPITDTTRDEFSPAVSPDGKRIAHVSNHLGNIDLFTMPVSGGEKRHVRITGLKFRQPSGHLQVRVTDEMGNPTRVRLYVRASDGKAYCPAGSPIYYLGLDPDRGREGFFVAGGDNTFPVPAGSVRLVALKGVEYDIAERLVDVAADKSIEVQIQMRRWTNWNQRGWYTGENHFHANYNGNYYQRPSQSLAWLQAEDLNTATMMVANHHGAFVNDKEFFRGGIDSVSTPRYLLYWGQEYRNDYPLGHMVFLNIRKLVPPSYTSVPGSDSPFDFPLNTMAALEARRQGGLVSYPHPMGGRDVFDTGTGAKEIPVGAALGTVDSVDILPFGEPSYELWYRMLNSGFKIASGAGTDVFTNWRGINQVPGGAREYVEIGPVMNWERWIARFREGRNFVTNGPLLTFTLNGQPIGAEIRVSEGLPYRAQLAAEVSSRVPLRVIEFVRNGVVIESREIPPDLRSFRLEKEILVDRSSWFAVRVAGRPSRGIADPGFIPRAHSSAIYVRVGEPPTLVKADLELMIRWVDRLWILLEERNNFGPGDNRERARAMIMQARKHFEAKLAASR